MKGNLKKTIVVGGPLLLLLIITGFFWKAGLLTPKAEKPPGPFEKINVGTALNALSGLLYVAQDQGFDKKFGLEIFLKICSSGEDAISNLQAGRTDVACCAEFVLVSEILAGARDLRCLGIFCSGSVHELIARRDRGISRIEDLRGKTIGVPMVHSASFFLGRFLSLHDISLSEVNLVAVKPSDMADALATGRVDAGMAWEPRTFQIKKQLGANAVIWPGQEGQDLFWLLLSRPEVIQKRGPALEKLLQALAQTAHFARENPQAISTSIARHAKIPLADLQAGKSSLTYDLCLDQALLLAMEDQARWMIENKLTGQKQVPDFLGYIDADILLKSNPRAVRLVLPGKGRPG